MTEYLDTGKSNALIVMLLCLFLLSILVVSVVKRSNRKHRYNRKKSKEILARIQTFGHHGQRINYLRKINPFVFEELLLDAFQAKGYQVKRNSKYTGDNGIDGIAWKDGKKFLIQAKRYKGHINLKHLKEFSSLVKQQGCYGLFCHTGRTGKHSKEVERGDSNIAIISGESLVKLIMSKKPQ